MPRFLQCFLCEVEAEIALSLGDLPTGLAALERLDGLGGYHMLWLENAPVLAPLRALPEAQPFRERMAERAGAVAVACGMR